MSSRDQNGPRNGSLRPCVMGHGVSLRCFSDSRGSTITASIPSGAAAVSLFNGRDKLEKHPERAGIRQAARFHTVCDLRPKQAQPVCVCVCADEGAELPESLPFMELVESKLEKHSQS